MYMCMNVNIFPCLMNCSTEGFCIQNIFIINISIIILIMSLSVCMSVFSFCPFLASDLVYYFIFLFVCYIIFPMMVAFKADLLLICISYLYLISIF